MPLSVLSFSYRTTPVALREQMALAPGRAEELLQPLRRECGLDELMILATCNRVELYFVGEDPPRGMAAMQEALGGRFDVSAAELAGAGVQLHHRPALNHLFRVASSLESMVVGEPQIVGQIKTAFEQAVTHGTAGPVLTSLMNRVLHAVKRVRNETGIARNAVSVSYVAVELAQKIYDELADRTVLVVGAGEMAELALQHLLKAGVGHLLITNRTFANAVALAERYQGSVVRYEELSHYLGEADIVLSSTGATGYVVTRELARQAQRRRRNRPLFFIDIAVPRDIDPAVNDLADVYCYDIDDLQAVANANRAEREREALHAQRILESEIDLYERWRGGLAVVPTIKALRRTFHDTAARELETAQRQLARLAPEDRERVQRLMRRLVQKLLHMPSTRLRQMAEDVDGTLYAEALATLFELEPESEAPPRAAARVEGAAANRRGDVADHDVADNVVPWPLSGTEGN